MLFDTSSSRRQTLSITGPIHHLLCHRLQAVTTSDYGAAPTLGGANTTPCTLVWGGVSASGANGDGDGDSDSDGGTDGP